LPFTNWVIVRKSLNLSKPISWIEGNSKST
jgi:hypothetical protein